MIRLATILEDMPPTKKPAFHLMGERLVRLQPDYSLFFYLCWVSSFLLTLV